MLQIISSYTLDHVLLLISLFF